MERNDADINNCKIRIFSWTFEGILSETYDYSESFQDAPAN
jgi:hypothetical protein